MKAQLVLVDGHAEVDFAKRFSGKNVCYVTLCKTWRALDEELKRKRVDTGGFLFVDVISGSFGETKEEEHVYYISSPSAITELSLVLGKLLHHEFDALIFDTISNLTTYHDLKAVEQFVVALLSKARDENTDIYLFAHDIKEHGGLLQKVGALVDRTVKA